MQFSKEMDIVEIMSILVAQAMVDGGFSFNFHDRSMPVDGFVVSVFPHRAKVIPAAEFNRDAVIMYANNNCMILRNRDSRNMMGCWYDKEIDSYVMDCSVVVDSLEEAIALGRQHEQKAVYDLAGARDVSCKPHENLDYGRRCRCLPVAKQPNCGCYECLQRAAEV